MNSLTAGSLSLPTGRLRGFMKCDVTGIELLPDGYMNTPTSAQVMKCPWFWSKKKKQWFQRDDWLPVYKNLDTNPWEKDEDFA